MALQILSLVVLGAIFLIGTWKSIHLGLLALGAAFGVGILVAGQSLDDILSDFPVGLFVLLLGISYLFSLARQSGAIDWIVQRALAFAGDRDAVIPWVFFALAVLLGAMGSTMTSLVLAPIVMSFTWRQRLHPMLMALTIVLGAGAGGMAPTSLYGVVVNGVAADAGMEAQPWLLFGVTLALNTLIFAVAFMIFGGRSRWNRRGAAIADPSVEGRSGADLDGPRELPGTSETATGAGGAAAPSVSTLAESTGATTRLTSYQVVCLTAVAALIVLVVGLMAAGVSADVGVIALAIALVVSLLYPSRSKPALDGIDWSTILLVGGILTYVGVMERLGTIDMLGHAAGSVGSPVLAAFALCIGAAFISAFATTTGIIGALIPLAIPLMAAGDMTGYGLIIALAISSSLVDGTPFSAPGALCTANAEESQRPRLTALMLRWGFSMIIIGPLLTVPTLVMTGL